MWYAVNNALEGAIDDLSGVLPSIREATKQVADTKTTAAILVTDSLRLQLERAEQLDKSLRGILLAIQSELTVEKEASK